MEQTELSLILEQHKLWIDGKGGKRAILSGANLGGADLTGANFTDANLEGANLSTVNFSGADLIGANLSRANLSRANLYHANLGGANLMDANLMDANLMDANLTGANLTGANLKGSIGLPDISWVIPGCLVQLNKLKYCGFYAGKERKHDNFIQDSFGFFIQDNVEEKTFDMLLGDRIIRGIPDWVKYSGMKQILS